MKFINWERKGNLRMHEL